MNENEPQFSLVSITYCNMQVSAENPAVAGAQIIIRAEVE